MAKILDNMEIGHNILHGQWDWMRDPKIHSSTWEWDHATPAEQWKVSHNELHHNFTNVVGKDNDLGYGIMRVDEDQKWIPFYLLQPLWNAVNAMFFEYGIAAYDLELRGALKSGRTKDPAFKSAGQEGRRQDPQAGHQGLRRAPAAVGSLGVLHTLAANFTANIVRNVWAHSVIMCGHFPEGVETFERKSIEGETHGEWYVRQMLGSANISGSPLMHIMTGNLSHQIEHHLFPDLPSNRYARDRPAGRGAVREVRPRATAPGRCRSRSTPPGTRWSDCRCPTAGWPRPTARTCRASWASCTRWSQAPRVNVASSRPRSPERCAASRRPEDAPLGG